MMPANHEQPIKVDKKINGVSFVSPPDEFDGKLLQPIQKRVNANWVAISPFAFAYKNKADIYYDSPRQWWGERPEGIRHTIKYAKKLGLNVMLKPQVWMPGSWVGDFNLLNETEWKKWEQEYRDFVLPLAEIAAQFEVPLFCIGTEYKYAVRERPKFWRNLITEIREFYCGELTYAANWDNFEQVAIWNDLDYIGVDSYFPLIPDKTPEVKDLIRAWKEPLAKVETIQKKFNKPVLFTEYGYLCVDGTGWRHWENEANIRQLSMNNIAQKNAFEALYRTFWERDWFAGGFIWKWFLDPYHSDEPPNKGYDPQGKPVEKTIREWYTKTGKVSTPQ